MCFYFPNLILRVNSLSIAMWSWSSYKRGMLGQIWDIGQVPSRNFDWLSFTRLPLALIDYLNLHTLRLSFYG
jgi:hypothetical protein